MSNDGNGPRVRQVAELKGRGMTYRQIAARLGLRVRTVYGYACTAGVSVGYRAHDADEETPREAHDRVRADLISGKRCGAPLGMGVCCLLTPCADHDR